MRVLIIGAGAIGSLLGGKLALAGHAVTLVGRASLVEAVRERGLSLTEPGGTVWHAQVAAAPSIAAALAADERYDLALLTVKAYDTAAAVAELQAALQGPMPILTMQNGVGNEETLAAAFGSDAVIAGVLDTPVSVASPGEVRIHRAAYNVGLAPVGRSPVTAAAEALTTAGFAINLAQDYRALKWTKLLMNMLANASAAILDWTPAQVMAHPISARLEARAWQEALKVMARLGVRPVRLSGYPLRAFAPIARRLPESWLAGVLGYFVRGGRGSKMPSLQMALRAGKPSEVNWLNGSVARYGEKLGVPTPVNHVYGELLTALTRDEAARDFHRGHPERLAALVEKMG